MKKSSLPLVKDVTSSTQISDEESKKIESTERGKSSIELQDGIIQEPESDEVKSEPDRLSTVTEEDSYLISSYLKESSSSQSSSDQEEYSITDSRTKVIRAQGRKRNIERESAETFINEDLVSYVKSN